jgi:hypothetical protein
LAKRRLGLAERRLGQRWLAELAQWLAQWRLAQFLAQLVAIVDHHGFFTMHRNDRSSTDTIL